MGKIVPLYKNCIASCVIAADTHIDEKHPQPWLPQLMLKRALSDAAGAQNKQDAFIVIGDTTSRGSRANWELTEACFRKYPSPAAQIFLPLGNHDTWNDNGYEDALREYAQAITNICGKAPERQYFSADIRGYRFIFMGSTGDGGAYPMLGQPQLAWLDEKLADGAKDGRPVFVFNHESLNGRHGLPQTGDADPAPDPDPMESGIGTESDEVEKILKKYPNVFFFSGHSHMGFSGEKWQREKGYATIEQDGCLTLINLPSNACGNHSGENNRNCVGLVLEIYADKVVLRLRDFLLHKWFCKVPVRSGAPFFEKEF